MNVKGMKMDKTNCLNCGAPIDGFKCEYCGTLFYDFTELPLDGKTPTYVRIRTNNSNSSILMKVFFDKIVRDSYSSYQFPKLTLEGLVLEQIYKESKRESPRF